MDTLKGFFRPEFLNRIDEIIIFSSITMEGLKSIVNLQLGRLKKRLRLRDITLNFSDELITHLTQAGYEPSFGARPMKRVIVKQVQDPIARNMLNGEILSGDKLTLDYKNNRVVIKRIKQKNTA